MKIASKKGYVLLEVIISIVLFSILILGTVEFIFSLRQESIQTTNSLVHTLKLESTRLFLVEKQDLSPLVFSDDSLYYDGMLLLDKVSTYQIKTLAQLATIDICIENDTICQTWKIRV